MLKLRTGSTIAGVSQGGGGEDALNYSGWSSGGVTADFASGVATGTGGVSGFESVLGSPQADVLTGGRGADVIAGGGGADTLTGGGGADTFLYKSLTDSGPGAYDTLADFTHGQDRIALGGLTGGIVGLIHDAAGETGVVFAPSAEGAPQGVILAKGDVEASDVDAGPEARFVILGSDQPETLVAGDASDSVSGGGGDDAIVGGGGQDYLTGGAGADTFRYLALSDSLLSAYDGILDFEHGVDRIDLSAVDGGMVNIVHVGGGLSAVFFAPSGRLALGAVVAAGDVEASDLIVSTGAMVVTTGAFSAEPPPVLISHADHHLADARLYLA